MTSSQPIGRRRIFGWSLVFGYLQKFVAISRNILLVPMYLYYIELPEYGGWLATGAIYTQLVIGNFGFSGPVIQRTSSAIGSGDDDMTVHYAAAGLFACGIFTIAFVVITLVSYKFLVGFVELDQASRTVLEASLLIAGTFGSFNALNPTSLGLLRCLSRPVAAGLIALGAEVIGIAVAITMLVHGYGLFALAVSTAIRVAGTGIVSTTLCILALKKRKTSELRSNTFKRALFDVSRDGKYQLATDLSYKAHVRADTFFVGAILGPSSAAVYGLTIRAIETLQMLAATVGGALDASLANFLSSKSSASRRAEVYQSVVWFSFAAASFGFAFVLLLNGDFVTLWAGSELYGGNWVSALFGLGVVAFILSDPAYAVLTATGKFNYIAKVNSVVAVVHVCCVLVAAQFGLVTVAFVAAMTSCARTVLMHGVLHTRLSTQDTVFLPGREALRFPFASGLGVLAYLLLPLTEIEGWISLLSHALLLLALLVLATLLIAGSTVSKLFVELRSLGKSVAKR